MLLLVLSVLRFVLKQDIPTATCAQQRMENLQEYFTVRLTPSWVTAGRLSDVSFAISSFSFLWGWWRRGGGNCRSMPRIAWVVWSQRYQQLTVNTSTAFNRYWAPKQENESISNSLPSAFSAASFLGQNNTFPEEEWTWWSFPNTQGQILTPLNLQSSTESEEGCESAPAACFAVGLRAGAKPWWIKDWGLVHYFFQVVKHMKEWEREDPSQSQCQGLQRGKTDQGSTSMSGCNILKSHPPQMMFSSCTWTISILTGLQLPFIRNSRSGLPTGQNGGVDMSCLRPAQEHGSGRRRHSSSRGSGAADGQRLSAPTYLPLRPHPYKGLLSVTIKPCACPGDEGELGRAANPPSHHGRAAYCTLSFERPDTDPI